MRRVWQHPANGISLAVHSRATGPARFRPVLLLPGTGATARDWDSVAGDLARDRVVHAVNLRGHGLSSWPGDYSIEAMGRDVLGLLPVLGGSLDLVGHSLGGLVAARVARESRQVSRLVLEDVGLPHPGFRPSPPGRTVPWISIGPWLNRFVRRLTGRIRSGRKSLRAFPSPPWSLGEGPKALFAPTTLSSLAASWRIAACTICRPATWCMPPTRKGLCGSFASTSTTPGLGPNGVRRRIGENRQTVRRSMADRRTAWCWLLNCCYLLLASAPGTSTAEPAETSTVTLFGELLDVSSLFSTDPAETSEATL